eukprot:jgi/Tetstr1/433069/TSEL_022403.t2
MPIRDLFLNTGERSAGSAVPIWACRRCGWKLVDNATRFARHVLRCPSTQPGDRELAHAHLGSPAGASAAQLKAISATADEFSRAFTLEGKAHVRSLFEDTQAIRSGEKTKLFRCKRCGHECTENATRFSQHILKCDSATEEDKAIAQEHQSLTAKRRGKRQARQSDAASEDLQTEPVVKAEPYPKARCPMPAEARHGILDLGELDWFVDEGFEEELARLASHSQPPSFDHIPAGAEGDIALAALATAPYPMPQGISDMAEPPGTSRGNSAFLPETATDREQGDLKDIQDLLPMLDMVTMPFAAAEAEPEHNIIMPVTANKRQRGQLVAAGTVSIGVDEYQQWRQWAERMAMPKIVQVPDMEYCMFENLYSYFIGHAMSSGSTYLSLRGAIGPSCNAEMIGLAVSDDWAQLGAIYKTMVTCCSKAHARYVLEKASSCPERIAGIYNSTLAIAQDTAISGIRGALQKWGMIPRLDRYQQAVYNGLDAAFQHMTIDDDGSRHAPAPQAEGAVLGFQHFTSKYGPFLRNLYWNNSLMHTRGGCSFAEQVQQPHFGGGSAAMTVSGGTPSNAVGISEADFSSWFKQATDLSPLMESVSRDRRTAIAVTAFLTEYYCAVGWDLVLVIY